MKRTGVSSAIGSDTYRPDIDGLRAVAVALVVTFHAFPDGVAGGFIGVDVFFVISGFLITTLIVSRLNNGTFRISDFYFRRARRILPALVVVTFVTLAIGRAILPPADIERLGLHAIAGAFFVPNLVFWGEAGYFDVAAIRKPLLHLWSLGVEEQFYLVWPVLLIVLWRRRQWAVAMLTVIVLASLAYSIYSVYHHPVSSFYSPVSRLWELGVGGLLAISPPRVPLKRHWSLLGVALIVGSAFLYSKSSRFPGLLATIPVAGTAMVIAAGARFLASGPIVLLGLISYPLYLWHWPLLSFAYVYEVATPFNRVLVVVVSVLLAWITYRQIECPLRFGRWKTWGVTAGLAGTVAAAFTAGLVYANERLLLRYPKEIRPILEVARYDYRDDSRFQTCWLLDSFEPFPPACRSQSMVIWGDSYAARLYPGLATEFHDVGQFTRSSCLPVLRGDEDSCAVGNRWVMEEIRRTKPRQVIIFAAWLNYTLKDGLDKEWQFASNLGETLRQVRAAGVADVVLIGPFPVFGTGLPNEVYQYWTRRRHMPDRLPPAVRRYDATDAFLRGIAVHEGARYISLFSALCNEHGCLTHTPDSAYDLLTWDAGHLTTTGAAFVVRHLGLSPVTSLSTPTKKAGGEDVR